MQHRHDIEEHDHFFEEVEHRHYDGAGPSGVFLSGETKPTPLEVLQLVVEDCEHDAKTLEGVPATGRVIAETFGRLYAAIKAVAMILDEHITEGETT